MPQYVVIRVSELPQLDRQASGLILRVTATDESDALMQAANMLKETRSDASAVYGVTLASNIVRKTVRASAPVYTVE